MIPSVIQNYYHFPPSTTPRDDTFQELKKGLSTELFSTLPVESPIRLANRPEYGNTFSGWGVQYDWVGILRWYPHAAPRTMLLKMTFIFKPEVKVVFLRQANQFFYIDFVLPGPLWRLMALVCATGIPTGEILAGTDVGRFSPCNARADDGSEVSHPRGLGSNQIQTVTAEGPRRWPVEYLQPLSEGGRDEMNHEALRSRFPRIVEPNTELCDGPVRKALLPLNRSCHYRREERHEADDHNGIPQI